VVGTADRMFPVCDVREDTDKSVCKGEQLQRWLTEVPGGRWNMLPLLPLLLIGWPPQILPSY
jgi:hypothetical protein